MSMVFGEWRREGTRAEMDIGAIQKLLAGYAPDSFGKYERPELTILHCGLHSTPESTKEVQPLVTRRGTVLAWTGRLDNRTELMKASGAALPPDVPDVNIVAAAYSRLGVECLRQVIGDWTISIWEARTQTLLLARDPIGSLPFYFSPSADGVRWSNALDALMLSPGQSLELNEAYIAGWLLSFPPADLSPYREVSVVPPGCLVRFYRGTVFISRYWDFSGARTIGYANDQDYEEHFRSLFRQAVARRLRARGPVLAELSGGVDSSSIVCMADAYLREERPQEPRLETISYYDDDEPNWDERRNFSRIEALRGKSGFHIDCRDHYSTIFEFQMERLAATPSSVARGSAEVQHVLKNLCETQGCRVLLSGIGGDEALGGVPIPFPELEDLLAGFHLRAFVRQLQRWSAVIRRPALTLATGTLARFLPSYGYDGATRYQIPWLHPEFRKRNAGVLESEQSRVRFWGERPSFQENLDTFTTLQRLLASQPLAQQPAYERRYPYLDRDLLEFIFAIPRDQILRPGDRRSLMRRALAGIVPPEVLFQKRKAAAVRGPVGAVVAAVERLLGSAEPLEVSRRGFIVPERLAEAMAKLKSGESIQIVPVIRLLALEGWLRNLRRHGGIAEGSKQQHEAAASRCVEGEPEPIAVS